MKAEQFIEKFQKLLLSQPVYSLRSVVNTNCPYVHCVSRSKDSYMCFTGYKCEDCFYCHFPNTLRDCCDTYHCVECELCYECVYCERCYNCDFCLECVDSRDLKFCYDVKGSQDCFGCVGLRRKEYHIFNEPYSKEGYAKKLTELKWETEENRKIIWARVEALRLKYPHVESIQVRAENCVGDHIYNSKNCFSCFSVTNLEDGAYCYHTMDSKDLYDCDAMVGELLYECVMGYDLYNCNFCLQSGNLKDSEYCVRVFNSKNMFGCVSVSGEKFMILNERYSPGAWRKEMRQIREEFKKIGQYTNWLPDVWDVD